MIRMSVPTPLGDGKHTLNKIRGTRVVMEEQAMEQDTFIVWAAPLMILIGLLIALFLYR
jgi:hypothetical protein